METLENSAATATRMSGRITGFVAAALVSSTALLGACAPVEPMAPAPAPSALDLAAMCQPEVLQSIAGALSTTTVTVERVGNGPFPAATSYVAAKGNTPAYCQVTGKFVTNKATGKTANFLATFPENWNGKYLQLGCSGHCGQFFVSNPALPTITVTAQGQPNQIIEKGYASFATDEGHEGLDGASWAVRKDGTVDRDYVDDLLFRAQRVMADMGKEFTHGFYARAQNQGGKIERSYFTGCSGGGRDALVAASYMPEKFDGIIAGSPYDPVGVSLQGAMIGQVMARPGAKVPGEKMTLMRDIVNRQCDANDGVRDGIIQNPAACDFVPERDLPVCKPGSVQNNCFSPTQVETISALTTAITDERGNVLQPAYSISDFGSNDATIAELGQATLKYFVFDNEPGYADSQVIKLTADKGGAFENYRAVVSSEQFAKVRESLRLGSGRFPENAARMLKADTKLLIWHNFSDELLNPYMSVNYYKKLAAMYGGYAKLQEKARLFMLPGTTHCSITSVGPNGFDPLTAMENWVEHGQAPDELTAFVRNTQFMPGAPKPTALQYPEWTMPLCKFPEMARYKGTGDTKDAKNWYCPKGDTSLLEVGVSGRRAGVIDN